MNTRQKIDALWEQFRDAIDASYKNAKADRPLHGYARNVSMSDSLEVLLWREIENEKQHRRVPYQEPRRPKNFPPAVASKLILMNNVLTGSKGAAPPLATDFLMFRQTAVEAQVLGFLVKKELSAEWGQQVQSLDYAELMKNV